MGLPLNTVPVVTQSSGRPNGHWAPRKLETLTCPSGQVVQVRRPGPEFMLRVGKYARTFTSLKDQTSQSAEDPAEHYLETIAKLNDEELAALMIFAREYVTASLVEPKLSRNPNYDAGEIGPDDLPMADFWFLFGQGMTGFEGLTVPVGETEVQVSDLGSFRGDSGVSGPSVDSAHLPPETEQPTGDRGVVSST